MSVKIPPHFKLLFSAEQIEKRVSELASEISAAYEGKELHIICVLKGATMFHADLTRKLTVPVTYDFLSVSSYKGTESSGVVKLVKDLDEDIESRHVLVLEDIIDTGLTLNYIERNLQTRKVASLATASFLDRPDRRKVELKLDYVGFVIPDCYVVGYGLDCEHKYRQFKDIYAIN
ncbi:MAG: hypoxanthine phosphoribosyltransferase [bacterium]|jgi:hypoxanthine phosphoribosyltransferase